jgi:hypothetical protein
VRSKCGLPIRKLCAWQPLNASVLRPLTAGLERAADLMRTQANQVSTAARIHQSPRRRGDRVAARGARTAEWEAADRGADATSVECVSALILKHRLAYRAIP